MLVELTIDGRRIEVDEGATILDAARRLGIEIPTLCHDDSVEPVGSCFLCVVQVDGRVGLVPACVARAGPGMVVTTDSDDVRDARRMALELLLSDHAGDCEAPCTLACPAHLDIPAFIRQTASGRHAEAKAVVMQRIPLPGVLGRICRRYCERVCRRRELDAPVAVCALKRFAAQATHEPPRAEPTGKRIAIVGAGPAGLSAAWYLLAGGHSCTILDARPEPGGALRYGVPAFQLPRDVLDGEIDAIRRMGADFRMSTRLGVDVTLGELRDGFAAVLIATGAQVDVPLGCPGSEHSQPALEFLRLASGVKGTIAVVGDGQEAVSAARTALRLGADRVVLISEKPRDRMACFNELVDEAEAEGVELQAPVRVAGIRAGGKGALTITCERDSGAFSIEASHVIGAAGRAVDCDLLAGQGLAVTARGAQADRATLATGLDGVFVAGEVVSGPADAVRAVAAGRRAAVSIDQYLRGSAVTGERAQVNVLMRRLSDEERSALFVGASDAPRARPALLDPARRRTGFDEVEGGLSEADAVKEAGRCLQCDCIARDNCKLRSHATEYGASAGALKGERRAFERDASHGELVYESGKCILCGLCGRIAEQEGEPLGMTFTARGFATRAGAPLGASLAAGLTVAAVRCAAACPTGALAHKRKSRPLADGTD